MRLSNECLACVITYNNVRYSHWPKEKLKERKQATIKKLKSSSPEIQAKFISEVKDFLKLNGIRL